LSAFILNNHIPFNIVPSNNKSADLALTLRWS